MVMENGVEWVTELEAARQLGFTRQRAHALKRLGRLVGHPTNRRLVSLASVQAWKPGLRGPDRKPRRRAIDRSNLVASAWS